jgi:hypothetical protein
MHAQDRVEERLTLAGWQPAERNALFAFAEAWADRTDEESEAIRLKVLPAIVRARGDAYGVESNGNEVWAVYRHQELITVMLRRSEQPVRNLRVHKVTRY